MKALAALTLVSCFSLRTVDSERTGTTSPVCGNGIRDQDEVCDGSDIEGTRSCIVRAAGAGGEVQCSNACALDTSGCVTKDSDKLELWLSAHAADPAGTLVDHSSKALSFTASQPGLLSLTTTFAAASDPPNDRAFELALGTMYTVYTTNSVAARTPITYELGLSTLASTPTDHEMVVFTHEPSCTLSLVPLGGVLHARATCGAATVDHPQALTAGGYAFIAVQVSRGILSLWVNGQEVTQPGAPVLSGTGRFGLGNSLDPADGTSKQFAGRIDELRVLTLVRSARELCMDANGENCPD